MNWEAQVSEVAYRDSARNSDKYYRVYHVWDDETADHRVVYQWGRQGSNGQSQCVVMHDAASAQAAISRKLSDKTAKGYQEVYSKKLPGVAADILELAGINAYASANVRSQDPMKVLLIDIDTCRRLAMGGNDDVTKAVIIRSTLRDQLASLRSSIEEAEGQVEIVDVVLGAKLSA